MRRTVGASGWTTAPRTRRPRRRRDLIARAVADERVILDRRAGLVHRLNSTASFVWDRCDGLTSVDAIAAALAARFAVDRPRARADVRATVARLAALGLLQPERDREPPRG